MTEKEFAQQVWRIHDQITTTEGVQGKVLVVNFNTKSVRAYISGAPEWLRCELIETHTTGNGANGDDIGTIEMLQTKIDFANQRMELQKERIQELEEKLSHSYAGDLLKNVNVILSVAAEKKKRLEKIEGCMQKILEVVEKMDANNENQEITEV